MSETIQRRIATLSAHLTQDAAASSIVAQEVAGEAKYCAKELRNFIEPTHQDVRDRLQDVFVNDPLWKIPLGKFYNQPHDVQREITLQRMHRLREHGFTRLVHDDVASFIAYGEATYFGDLQIAVRLNGVQISLFCGAVLNLGAPEQHARWIPDALDLKIFGCFALTELGHGSNAAAVETTITYDKAASQFVVNTPSETAQKFWIGGAVSASHAVVFGQLNVDGENKGVHAVVVPLRKADGSRAAGVTVADCGHKQGLNGVDNGRIWFDQVRVPRENLLSRFSRVEPDGTFVSELKTPNERFHRHVGELVGGRVFLSAGSNNIAKVVLATAVRYALTRRQFGQGEGPETLILDYPLHQRRLLPFVASLYVYSIASNNILRIWRERTPQTMKSLHVLAAGMKPVVTWNALAAMQAARECCGGNGYGTFSKVGIIKNEADVWLTFEGDNWVLLQQMSRHLLQAFQKQMAAGVFSGELSFMNDVNGKQMTADSPDLRSYAFQHAAFAQREATLLKKAGLALQEAVGKCASLMEAWNSCTDLTGELSKAHTERVCLEWYEAAVSAAPATLQPVLATMRSLYALWRIHDDVSFFRNTEIAYKHRRAVHEQVNKLCGELRPHARSLVDGFGIRDELLGVIGNDWIQHLSRDNIPNHF